MGLLKLFVEHGICPNVLRRGNSILLLEIKECNLRFLTSNTYVNGNELELINQFNLPITKMFFPDSFLNPNSLSYVGSTPPLTFFISQFNSVTQNKAISSYWKSIANKTDWSLKKELSASTESDLLILASSMLTFLKDTFEFQLILHSSLQNETLQNNYLNPFNAPCCSIGSFIYNLFSIFYMNFLNIFVVKNEYGIHSPKVSKLEHEYVSYMEFLHPEKGYISAFNNNKGQKYFSLKPYDDDCNLRGTYVDLYSPITKQVIYFNGCYFHHHCQNCKIYPQRTTDTPHTSGKTLGQLNDDFQNRLFQLFIQHPNEIDEATTIWECDFREQRHKEPLLSYLNTEYPKSHPRQRLCPRHAVRGALFDTYIFKWSKKLFPDEKCYFLDVNSLYSFCATSQLYPLGKYKILIGDELSQLKIEQNKFLVNGSNILGTVLLTILPPGNLLHPFLSYRKKDGSTVNTLCKICCEKYCKTCNHTDFERALTATYFINEVEYALSLNYTILAIYEVHYYSTYGNYLKDFCNKLNYLKLKHSNLENGNASKESKEQIFNFINQEMEFEMPLMLSEDTVNPNVSKRNFYKLCGNSFFGKFLQRTDRESLVFINDQSQLNDLYYSENEILDVMPLNENICIASIKKQTPKRVPNRKFNIYIGGQITANARIFIHQKLTLLSQMPNVKIFKIDCDSLIFSCKEIEDLPLNISPCIGHFKHEVDGEILSYYALGPKQYCVTFKKGDSIQSMIKLSGLCLNADIDSETFNEKTFQTYVDAYLEKTLLSQKIKQERRFFQADHLKITTKQNYFTLTNVLSNRRNIKRDNRLTSTPFGFKEM